MRLGAKEWKILGEYAQLHGLRPQLSVPSMGQFRFLNRDGGEVNVTITTMVNEITDLHRKDKQQ